MAWENTPAGINLGVVTDFATSTLFGFYFKQPTLKEVIHEAEQSVAKSDVAGAFKLIFRRVDQAMKASEFEEINTALAEISVSGATLEVLIALLTATLPARSKLAARRRFFEDVQQAAKDRGRWTKTLFSGLEN